MSALVVIFAVTSLLILINALYVAAEFATVRARKTRLTQLAEEGNRSAKIMLGLKLDQKALDAYIAACQLGITASSLVLGAYSQNSVAKQLETLLVGLGALAQPVAQTVSFFSVLLIYTILQVILGELLPKSVAILYPESLATLTAFPVKWSQTLLTPFIWLFNGSGNLVLKILRLENAAGHAHFHSHGEIELLVSDSHEGGLIDDTEQQLLRNTLRMRELTARQVMIPRTRLVTASNTDTVEHVLRQAIEAGHTRIPIHGQNLDHITHFVHIKELFPLYLQGEENLSSILREVTYVPETMPIRDVWHTLNARRQYLVIVFDEYGNTAGLITFEDLLEEIFGELQDEFDSSESAIMYYDPNQGRTHLRADVLISDVNEYLNLNLPDEDADTIGGLVFSLLGQPPKPGDAVTINNLQIRVDDVSDRAITEISFELPVDFNPQIGEWETTSYE